MNEKIITFPEWKPQKNSIINTWDPLKDNLWANNTCKFFQALRCSSDRFIKNPDVREFIFKRDGYECVYCLIITGLQIDHVVSVYACSLGKIAVKDLNTASNLQTLCSRCNATKKP